MHTDTYQPGPHLASGGSIRTHSVDPESYPICPVATGHHYRNDGRWDWLLQDMRTGAILHHTSGSVLRLGVRTAHNFARELNGGDLPALLADRRLQFVIPEQRISVSNDPSCSIGGSLAAVQATR